MNKKSMTLILASLLIFISFAPIPILKAAPQEIEISYDNGNTSGGQGCSLPNGFGVRFTPPSEEYWVLRKVKFYGTRWANASYDDIPFYIEIWDNSCKELLSVTYKYSDYFNPYDSKWVTVDTPDVLIKGDFFVCIFPNMIYHPDDSQSPHYLNIAGNNDLPLSGRSYEVKKDTNSITRKMEPVNLCIHGIVSEPIRVPRDYQTIQDAVAAANPWGTILVSSGVYKLVFNQRIFIDKPLNLIGENKTNTIIDSIESYHAAIFLSANNVTIKNFTFRSSRKHYWPSFVYSGVTIESSYNTIDSNIFSGDFGVFLGDASFNHVSNNTMKDCDYGIYLQDLEGRTNFNTIDSNNISRCSHGIHKVGGKKNTISNNVITNSGDGIYVHYDSVDDEIINNTISNCGIGIQLWNTENMTLSGNNMTGNNRNFVMRSYGLSGFTNRIGSSNTLDGKPMYYWINEHNRTVPTDAGYVGLINCTYITVKDLDLRNNSQGVVLYQTTTSIIENITVSNQTTTTKTGSWYGAVELWLSRENIVSNCTLSNNPTRKNSIGLWISYSDNNTVINNRILNNQNGIYSMNSKNLSIRNNTIIKNDGGIYFTTTYLYPCIENEIINNTFRDNGIGMGSYRLENSTISRNIFMNNDVGISSERFSNNTFHHNDFILNFEQTDIQWTPVDNIWDDGKEGNYWSDYTGADLDGNGIGDTPYVIDGDNVDHYPLMKQYIASSEMLISALTKRFHDLNTKYEALKTELDELKTEFDQEIYERDREYWELIYKIRELNTTISELMLDIERLDRRYNDLLGNHTQLKGEVDKLKAWNQTISQSLNNMTQKIGQLEQRINELKSKQEVTIDELIVIRNLMYASFVLSGILIVSVVYLGIKIKVKKQKPQK